MLVRHIHRRPDSGFFFWVFPPQFFHEVLEVGFDQFAVFGEMLLVVGERDETRVGDGTVTGRSSVHLDFVGAANSPVANATDAAGFAFSTRKFDFAGHREIGVPAVFYCDLAGRIA